MRLSPTDAMPGHPDAVGDRYAGAILATRLWDRRAEIEQAALSRISRVSAGEAGEDGVYPYGLQQTVRHALKFACEALESPGDEAKRTPTQLLQAAQKAARRNVPLDVLLRGYLAGQALLLEYVAEEALRDGSLQGPGLHCVLRSLPLHVARLLDEVSTEYAQEQRRSSRSTHDLLALQVCRLLSASSLDTSAINYDFSLCHTGAIAVGAGAADAVRALATAGGYRLLLVSREDGRVWAWVGSQGPFRATEIETLVPASWPSQVQIAFGEPSSGFAGWRLTHRQAKAALPFALRDPRGRVHYADIALPASMLRDEVLFSSVRQRYLAALEDERDGGATLRATLRAYWAADRNVSSAAAALGVSRHTVSSRIRLLEERFGCPLQRCEGEVAAALRLEDADLHPFGS